jgi:sulfonate transport system substrate-binding protein
LTIHYLQLPCHQESNQTKKKEGVMSQYRKNVFAAVFALIVMLGAWGSSVAQEPLSLRIAVAAAAPDTWPVFVGIERGIFEKHGLEIKANTGIQSGPEAIRVMQAGDADLAAAGAGPTAAARSRGVPLALVVLLSGGYHNDDLNAMITLEGSGIRPDHPEDVKGKRVGVTLGTTPHAQLLVMLDRHNVPTSSVNFVNVKPADIAVALQQRDVDAVMIWEPNATHILENVDGSVLVTRGGGYVSGNAGIAALDEVVKNKREAVKRFVAGMSEATHWMRNNRDATAEIGTRWTAGLDLNVAKKSLVYFGFDPRISKNNVKGIKETVDFLVDKGLLDKAVDVTKMVNAELINEVMKEHPEYFDDLPALSESDILK